MDELGAPALSLAVILTKALLLLGEMNLFKYFKREVERKKCLSLIRVYC